MSETPAHSRHCADHAAHYRGLTCPHCAIAAQERVSEARFARVAAAVPRRSELISMANRERWSLAARNAANSAAAAERKAARLAEIEADPVRAAKRRGGIAGGVARAAALTAEQRRAIAASGAAERERRRFA